MPRKAIDSRIPTLIRNGIQEKKRSFIVVVGDRAKDVIVHLHYIISSVDIKQNRSVLWAYKKDLLGFTSHRKKRENKIRKEIKRGIREANTEDPFELFLTLQNIRYVYYKETEKILGNTYGMCILQDFEAITPNLLARTIETVEGGGLVLLLLKGMKSLKQLYTLSMDIHSRYRTEAHDDVVARFNERFVLSLGGCDSCLFVDDELNVLPISGGKNVKPVPLLGSPGPEDNQGQKEIDRIKDGVGDTQPISSLIKIAKTVDQAKSLLTFVEAISEKTLRSTVTLTAARGRGKSAALGVAVAAAVAYGYSNIFITSPSPENLKTLFEFIFKGFDALNYLDHHDYTIIQSTNPDFNKAIVKVNIHRNHRQTIQYIQPQDAYALGQAELVVIDEAAAIPLPLVKKLIGPYLVFMASTINGYEGTGRSLSLKLISQLREQSRAVIKVNGVDGSNTAATKTGKAAADGTASKSSGRTLREITLDEPIRYAQGDSVESWLNKVLCLNATLPSSKLQAQGCPHPSKCQLLHVNRDTLFSYHPVSEKFLQQMIALYVSSHYKNSPNDLQLMSDAPAHQLFVLVPPVDDDAARLPEPLCVVQIALEGQISKQRVLNNLNRGLRAGGDLIPWLVSQQFQDEEFAGLAGARIVRIATNPEYANMGYGSRALQLLIDFYEGKFTNLAETDAVQEESLVRVTDAELEDSNLQSENIKVRDINSMPPLFARLSERRAPHLDYLGVSYGLTGPLHKFWKRASFAPVYLRQTPNELTGEHSCVMIRTLTPETNDSSWLGAFTRDFHRRFLSLLSYQFRSFPSILSLSIIESANAGAKFDTSSAISPLTKGELDEIFSPFDLKRLDSYANNMLDHHVILDMVPTIASLFFSSRLSPGVSLTGVQSSILLAIGLQRKALDDLEKELGLPISQLLAMYVKIIRKISSHFRRLVEGAVVESMPGKDNPAVATTITTTASIENEQTQPTPAIQKPTRPFLSTPLSESLTDELRAGASEVDSALKEKQRALIDALPLSKYEIDFDGVDDPVPTTTTTNPITNPITNPTSSNAWTSAEQQILKAVQQKDDPTAADGMLVSVMRKPPSTSTSTSTAVDGGADTHSTSPNKRPATAGLGGAGGGTMSEIYKQEIEGPREKKLKLGMEGRNVKAKPKAKPKGGKVGFRG